MAKGSSIKGKGGGPNGGNTSYSLNGRGKVNRGGLVNKVKQDRHPETHIYEEMVLNTPVIIMTSQRILMTDQNSGKPLYCIFKCAA